PESRSLVLYPAPSVRAHEGRSEAGLCRSPCVLFAGRGLPGQAHRATARAARGCHGDEVQGLHADQITDIQKLSETDTDMAITDVVVPQLSESVSEATLLEWKKQPGEAVEMDEILIEVETDKVVLEVPAPAAGVLKEIVKGDGATVVAGEVLARIDTEGKATAAAAPAAQAPAAEAAPAAAAAAPAPAAAAITSPAAGKILAEKGVDPATVEGSGRGGRITKGDALAADAGAKKPAAPVAPPSLSLDGRPEQRVPMSRLRARVAERLLQSQQEN